MGMYYERLLESAIQDPNDPGIDPKIIEDIAAENPDVEEAETGVVGDPAPVEEASMIMYESTYNYNQLMRRIGMVELQEASYGRDYILEGADIKGFFEKVKNILTNMFRAITKAFKNVLNRLTTAFTSDKKLATEHASAIEAGYKTEWTFKGYKLREDAIKYECESMQERMVNDCKTYLDSLKDGKENALPLYESTEHSKIIERNLSKYKGLEAKGISEVSDMRKALQKYFFGDEERVTFTNEKGYPGGVKAVLDLLKADKETKAIKEGYNKIKNDYKKALESIKKYEKAIEAKDYNGNVSKAFAACEKFSSATIFEKNVQNTVYSFCMKAAKAKRAQARRLALLWQRAGTKKNLDDKHPKIQLNSASLFGNIELV